MIALFVLVDCAPGTHACPGDPDDLGVVQRDGQEVFRWECRAWTFTGKRGTIVLRSQFTWIEAGGPYNIATGTWKVVRGTGQYAGVTGGGRSAQVGAPGEWLAPPGLPHLSVGSCPRRAARVCPSRRAMLRAFVEGATGRFPARASSRLSAKQPRFSLYSVTDGYD